jgi:hypothetical protein
MTSILEGYEHIHYKYLPTFWSYFVLDEKTLTNFERLKWIRQNFLHINCTNLLGTFNHIKRVSKQ